MMNLTSKDLRVILYALTVVKNYGGRFSSEADWLATKLRWIKSPINTFSQFKSLLSYGKKAY